MHAAQRESMPWTQSRLWTRRGSVPLPDGVTVVRAIAAYGQEFKRYAAPVTCTEMLKLLVGLHSVVEFKV